MTYATDASLSVESARYDTVADLAQRFDIHPSCITRHIIKGCKDTRSGVVIRPEGVLRAPGRWLIPVGSYEDFLRRVAAARQGVTPPPDPKTTQSRERQLARVDAELDTIGI